MGDMTATLERNDVRARKPIMTVRAASVHLDIPRTTINEWIRTGANGSATASRRASGSMPVMHSVPGETRDDPRLPFIALVEAEVLHSLRATKLSMQEIRAGVAKLRATTKNEYVLATRDIATDGGHLLYNAAAVAAPEWTRARNGQVAI
jgi:uncharacterized protein (DUF433 family)